jgi:N-carbamoylputrescine amidase
VYHKAHLSQRETGLFSAGDDLGTLTWRAFGLGVQICHDTHFPEMSLAQASCGAQILLMPFASPMGDPQTLRARWLRFLPARAYDSGCYVVALNQCGMSPGGRRFASLIMAFNPDGELIAQWCSDQPGELIVEVDTQVVEAARCRRPFLQQRRPEIYRFERNTHA